VASLSSKKWNWECSKHFSTGQCQDKQNCCIGTNDRPLHTTVLENNVSQKVNFLKAHSLSPFLLKQKN